jgi:hypothetical protein
VLASDGLFAEEARGGGGGLDNETVAELCNAAGEGAAAWVTGEFSVSGSGSVSVSVSVSVSGDMGADCTGR